MARYLVQIPLDTLSEDRKAGIAKSIVAAHHEISGDNPDAVQVAVTEIDAGCLFAGGRLIECDHISCTDTCRVADISPNGRRLCVSKTQARA